MIPLVERATTAERSHMRGTLKRAVWLLLTAMGLLVIAVFIGGVLVASQDSSPSTSVAAFRFSNGGLLDYVGCGVPRSLAG